MLLLESMKEEGVYACEAIALLANGDLGAVGSGCCEQGLTQCKKAEALH
jgi:hypothetical protein